MVLSPYFHIVMYIIYIKWLNDHDYSIIQPHKALNLYTLMQSYSGDWKKINIIDRYGWDISVKRM